MKEIKKVVLVLVVLIAFAYSVNAAENFSAQSSYDWLADQAGKDGSFGSVDKTALAIMALDAAGYDTTLSQEWLDTQLSTSYCYPSSSCDAKSTALSVLALTEVQDDGNFENIGLWYQDSLTKADVSGDWYLEVVTSSAGNCVVSYDLEGTLKEITVPVDAGSFTSCDSSHFLGLDDCLQANLISANPGIILDIDCSDLEGSVVLALVYKSSSTYYLLGNEDATMADFQINNGCYAKSGSSTCDMETTLFSDWALNKLGSTVNNLVYLKEKYDSTDAKEAALMYFVTKDNTYLLDLADLQKSDGSFDRDHYTTALAVLAFREGADYSTNIDNAKSYLREEQSTTGWGSSVENTALVLYAAFSDDDITPTNDGVEEVVECVVDLDCSYGEVCTDGVCKVEGTTTIGCTTDSDCNSGEVCLDNSCILSECDFGKFCKSGSSCCDYQSPYLEDVLDCPSDCSCGDGICDEVEKTASSTDAEYCVADCKTDTGVDTAECKTDDDCSTDEICSFGTCGKEPTVSGGSGWIIWVIILLLLVGLGVGGYFAYKKGYLDTVLSKFKKGGGSAPVTQTSYSPFTSRLPQQPKRPF